jgi:hypothetical protein
VPSQGETGVPTERNGATERPLKGTLSRQAIQESQVFEREAAETVTECMLAQDTSPAAVPVAIFHLCFPAGPLA